MIATLFTSIKNLYCQCFFSLIKIIFNSKSSNSDISTFRVAKWSGKIGKSGKTKKNDKSQVKMGVFEKSQEKINKKSDFVSSNVLNTLYFKAFE